MTQTNVKKWIRIPLLILTRTSPTVLWLTSTIYGGTIVGTVTDPFGKPLNEVQIFANREGETRWGYYASTDKNGSYQLKDLITGDTNLPSGKYMVVVQDDPQQFRMMLKETYLDGTIAYVNFRLKATYAIDDTAEEPFWGEPWGVKEYGQTFIADGKSIVKVSARVASEPSTFNVSILSDGPNGEQIGPTKGLTSGWLFRGHAYWESGEIPTIPGRKYYVKMTEYQGKEFVLCRDAHGNTYSAGEAYMNKIQYANIDNAFTISSDDDEIVFSYAVRGTNITPWAQEYAQGFIAKGISVLAISALTSLTGGLGAKKAIIAFSIHEEHPNGKQIGPTKRTVIRNDYWGTVTWLPGEVPTIPGKKYFVKLRKYGGDNPENPGFCAYLTSDTYRKGEVYIDGILNADLDLQAIIVEQRDNIPPHAPILQSPPDKYEITSLACTFTWIEVNDDATGGSNPCTYEIQISNDNSFSSPEVKQSGLTQSQYTLTSSIPNGRYYWRVRAKDNAGNWSEWSSTRTVIVNIVAPKPKPKIDKVEVVPNFVTKDNAKNVKIKYYYSSPGTITLRVYSIDGQLVKESSKYVQSEGSGEILWPMQDDNGVELPSGIYVVYYYTATTTTPLIEKVVYVK